MESHAFLVKKFTKVKSSFRIIIREYQLPYVILLVLRYLLCGFVVR